MSGITGSGMYNLCSKLTNMQLASKYSLCQYGRLGKSRGFWLFNQMHGFPQLSKTCFLVYLSVTVNCFCAPKKQGKYV